MRDRSPLLYSLQFTSSSTFKKQKKIHINYGWIDGSPDEDEENSLTSEIRFNFSFYELSNEKIICLNLIEYWKKINSLMSNLITHFVVLKITSLGWILENGGILPLKILKIMMTMFIQVKKNSLV